MTDENQQPKSLADVAAETTRGIGDNLPPDFADELIANATVKVSANYRELHDRARQLVEAVARVPATIDDPDVEKRAIDFVKQLRAVKRRADDARMEEKRPYMNAASAVDGWFATIIRDVSAAMQGVTNKVTSYQRRTAEEMRLKAEAKQEAAEKEALLADSTAETPEEHAEVDERLQAADDARQVATSRPADRSISRTALGASASLTSRWVHEIEEAKQIPLAKLRPYLDAPCLDKAIRGYIRGGGRELKGVRIYQEHKSVVR